MPKLYDAAQRPDHPYLRTYAAAFNYDDHFEDADNVRRAVAGYHGLCSFLDEQIGKVLRAIDETGHGDNTRIVYTSDHGDNLGARGVWGKSTMYEEAAAVPLIAVGDGLPERQRCATPVTLLDLYPFIMEAVGAIGPDMIDEDHHGCSIAQIANGVVPDRSILSEYHAMGSTTAAYMIRHGRWKYIHYVAHPPQLFDLEADPEELHDLGTDNAHAEIRAACEARLRSMLDPEETDRRAKARQAELMALNGGREAVIARGDLGFSPPPGYAAELG